MRWKRTIVAVRGSAEWFAFDMFVQSGVRVFVFHENTRNRSKVNRNPGRVRDETPVVLLPFPVSHAIPGE